MLVQENQEFEDTRARVAREEEGGASRQGSGNSINELHVAVLAPGSEDRGAIGVSDEEVGADEGVEGGVAWTHHEDSAVKVAFFHMVDVDGVQDCTRGGRADFPDGASESVARVEGGHGQALALAWTLHEY